MKKRILIIDDDKELCEELAFALTDEGYSVKTACNGSKGRQMVLSGRQDVVLLDIGLPQISGLEILKEAKEKKKDVKIIIITGDVMIVEKLSKKECAQDEKCSTLKLADAVMGKPIDMSLLIKKIEEMN